MTTEIMTLNKVKTVNDNQKEAVPLEINILDYLKYK